MSDFGDDDVQRRVELEEGVGRPERLSELVPRHELTRSGGQKAQGTRRLILERHAPAVPLQLARARIKFERPEPDESPIRADGSVDARELLAHHVPRGSRAARPIDAGQPTAPYLCPVRVDPVPSTFNSDGGGRRLLLHAGNVASEIVEGKRLRVQHEKQLQPMVKLSRRWF
jgi:hypothetical protein